MFHSAYVIHIVVCFSAEHHQASGNIAACPPAVTSLWDMIHGVSEKVPYMYTVVLNTHFSIQLNNRENYHLSTEHSLKSAAPDSHKKEEKKLHGLSF